MSSGIDVRTRIDGALARFPREIRHVCVDEEIVRSSYLSAGRRQRRLPVHAGEERHTDLLEAVVLELTGPRDAVASALAQLLVVAATDTDESRKSSSRQPKG